MLRASPLLFLPIAFSLPTLASAQVEVNAVLSGTLLVSGAPPDTGTVVLHRVTPEEAGDVDSVAVSDGGFFSFQLPNLPIPGSGEVFFASARYDGILYAGEPVSDPIQLDSPYAIRAFPTLAVPPEGIAFPISRREVWIDQGPIGWQVTDVLEIRNGQPSTLVPFDQGGVVWRYPLPEGAIGARVLQVGPVVGPARVDGTTLVASNPVLPAENYYIVQYDLETIEFDLPLPGETGLIQFMVREPAPSITVQGLAQQPPEEIEVGVTFLRWAGQALRDQSVVVRLGEEGGAGSVIWVTVALALLLVGASSFLVTRRPAVATFHFGRTRKDILVDVARLDEEHAALERPSPKVEASYRRRRAALLEQLREASRPPPASGPP